MRFSVWPNPGQPWEGVLELARHAESTGWDGVWFADHFMPNSDDAAGPTLECWTVLAGLAVAVPRLRVGALVSGNTYRHPAVLANMAAALDQLSGGRAILGLGAGWQENEHQRYGIELPPVKERLDRLDEACRVVRSLLDQDRTTFAGRHYRLDDAPLEPKPVQDRLPLLVGGGGERRTMRIAAEHADEWNVWGTPETMRHKIGVLERHCADLDRDPATIKRSTQALLFLSDDEAWLQKQRDAGIPMATIIGTVDQVRDTVGEYVEAGVDELIIPDFTLGTGARRLETYDRVIEEIAPTFR